MTDSSIRLGYREGQASLTARMREPAPGRLQLLTGPRQVGKTTLLLALAREFGDGATYAALDAPEAALPGFWEHLWREAAAAAGARGAAVLLLDEIQHLHDWPTRLKAEWDRVRRAGTPLHVVATGSSALRLGAGSRERLAGRFEHLVLTHWGARELADTFALSGRDAARAVVTEGAYPGAVPLRSDRERWRVYLRDAILEPAIGRDLLSLGAVRRPGLLRQVFAACATVPAEIMSLQKLRGSLGDPGALETVAHYLALLEEAYLVAGLEKFAVKPLRRRQAPPKILILSNAILAATDPRGAPSQEAEPARYGRWVENACLAHAWNAGQRVLYWREEPLEVDAVLEGSWGHWVLEIKTGSFPMNDLRGLLEFARRHPRYRALVLCDAADLESARRAGVEAQAWEEFLLDGAPGNGPPSD